MSRRNNQFEEKKECVDLIRNEGCTAALSSRYFDFTDFMLGVVHKCPELPNWLQYCCCPCAAAGGCVVAGVVFVAVCSVVPITLVYDGGVKAADECTGACESQNPCPYSFFPSNCRKHWVTVGQIAKNDYTDKSVGPAYHTML